MYKYLLACTAAFFLNAPLRAQFVAPADTTFPFNITLVSPDSSQVVSSKNLLRKGEVTVLAF